MDRELIPPEEIRQIRREKRRARLEKIRQVLARIFGKGR